MTEGASGSHLVQTPAQVDPLQPANQNLVLNISKEGDSPTSLGDLFYLEFLLGVFYLELFLDHLGSKSSFFVKEAYPLRCQHVTATMGMKIGDRRDPSQVWGPCPAVIRWLTVQK